MQARNMPDRHGFPPLAGVLTVIVALYTALMFGSFGEVVGIPTAADLAATPTAPAATAAAAAPAPAATAAVVGQ
jgi:hypothetical protein